MQQLVTNKNLHVEQPFEMHNKQGSLFAINDSFSEASLKPITSVNISQMWPQGTQIELKANSCGSSDVSHEAKHMRETCDVVRLY